jgi:hypothetical protein
LQSLSTQQRRAASDGEEGPEGDGRMAIPLVEDDENEAGERSQQ